MHSRPLMLLVVTYFVLALVGAPTSGQEAATRPAPQRFRELLRVGDTVLLRSVADSAAYYLELLTPQQAKEVNTAYATYNELAKRRDTIKASLETEGQLSERASLFVEQQKLETEMTAVSSARRSGPYAYEIAQVGEDFVSFKKPSTESFVPLHSIRNIYRRDTVTPRFPPNFGRRSSARSSELKRIEIRLKNTRAPVVAAVVNKTYPDLKTKVTGDAESNSLVIEADAATSQQLSALVRVLDKAFPDTTSPRDENGR